MFFCVIGGCWDNRLFRVELLEIYITPEKISLKSMDYISISQKFWHVCYVMLYMPITYYV